MKQKNYVTTMVIILIVFATNAFLTITSPVNSQTIFAQAKELVGMGEKQCKLRQYQNGIANFSKAIALNPKYAEAYSSRGAAYYELKQYQKTIDDSSKAISLNPKYFPAQIIRGYAYFELKQYQKAIDDFSKAIESSSSLSYVPIGSQPQDKVFKWFAESLRSKMLAPIYYYRGQAYEKLGKHDFAKNDLSQANKFGYKPEK